jgi:alpha-beta hydrolase superfamily lysophospholipase
MTAAESKTIFAQETSVGDSLHLPICSWSDSSVNTRAIILAIHGVTFYSGNFAESAKHLSAEGYPFYALDMRGFGRWQKEPEIFCGDSGIHYTETQQDLETVLRKLRSEFVNQKIYVLGESIGANLALWLASRDASLIDGIILSSPCIKACFHPTPRMLVDTFRGLMHPNTKHATRPYIEHYISDDPKVTAEYFADPLIVHKMSPAEMIKSLKTNALALRGVKDIPRQMPVLILAGQKDQIYKAQAIRAFAEQLGSENRTLVIEAKKGHILLETKFIEPEILTAIDSWLSKNTSDGVATSSQQISSMTGDPLTDTVNR